MNRNKVQIDFSGALGESPGFAGLATHVRGQGETRSKEVLGRPGRPGVRRFGRRGANSAAHGLSLALDTETHRTMEDGSAANQQKWLKIKTITQTGGEEVG